MYSTAQRQGRSTPFGRYRPAPAFSPTEVSVVRFLNGPHSTPDDCALYQIFFQRSLWLRPSVFLVATPGGLPSPKAHRPCRECAVRARQDRDLRKCRCVRSWRVVPGVGSTTWMRSREIALLSCSSSSSRAKRPNTARLPSVPDAMAAEKTITLVGQFSVLSANRATVALARKTMSATIVAAVRIECCRYLLTRASNRSRMRRLLLPLTRGSGFRRI